MKKSPTRACLPAVCLLLLAGAPASAASRREPQDFSTFPLAAGLSAGFGLVSLGAPPTAEPLALGGHALSGRTDTVMRVLVDEGSGVAFGYRLEAKAFSSTMMGVVRVEIRPLGREDEKELKRVASCNSCPAPRLAVFTPTRLPPTQIIRSGDTLVIDLLIRPDTGEKIADVIRFSYEPVTIDDLDAVREKVVTAFNHVRQADDLAAHGSLEAAAALYAKAAALRPDASTCLRLGLTYERLGRLEPAQREYEKTTRLRPDDAEAWDHLAVTLHRRGLFGKAAGAYERALKLKPDGAQTRRNLGTALLDRADLARAFEQYQKAHRLDPKVLGSGDPAGVAARDPGLQQYIFAKVYAAEKQLDAALQALSRAKSAGFRDLERVREDIEFKPFLDDPRLVALLTRGAHS